MILRVSTMMWTMCLLMGVARPASTAIHVPADQPTIQAALNAASVFGDEVVVAPGTYSGSGNTELNFRNKPTLLRSSGGPEVTIIDCGNTSRGIHDQINATADWTLRGFTFTNGRGGNYRGAAAKIQTYGAITIDNCIFRENGAGNGDPVMEGGALWIASAAAFVITDCLFEDNTAAGRGGAIYVGAGDVSIARCRFVGNSTGFRGGAISAAGPNSLVGIGDCVFWNNRATDWGGALYAVENAYLEADRSTFVGNLATFGSMAWTWAGGFVETSHCIIAFGSGEQVVYCAQPPGALLRCTDVFGNEGGAWTGCLLGQDAVDRNFSADPEFCDLDNGDFTLRSTSPCAPPGVTGCGQLGALPVGCGPVSVERESWGRVKHKYR